MSDEEYQTLPNGMRVRGDLSKLMERTDQTAAQRQHEDELIIHLLMGAA